MRQIEKYAASIIQRVIPTEHIRLTVISPSLLSCAMNTFTQRHYESIPALELNCGTNLLGNVGDYYNLSFSGYTNRTNYRKAGFGYFEKPYKHTANLPQVLTLNPEETVPETMHDRGRNFFVDDGYYRTLACNLESAYWDISLGGFISTEYVHHPGKECSLIISPKLETRLEVPILPRTVLLVRIQQHRNPLSINR